MRFVSFRKRFTGSPVATGLKAGFPIAVGYLPVAMAFGFLAKTAAVSLTDSFLCSLLVFAGASQFMALNLWRAGVAVGEIILATLLLNLRHLLMSATVAARLESRANRGLPLVAFGITDETFAVATTGLEPLTVPYLLSLEGIAYSSWVGGTVLGYLLGSVLPEAIQGSMGIALYALFVALLVPQIKHSIKAGVLALVSGGINLVLSWSHLLSGGWSMVLAIVVTAVAGGLLFRDEPEEVEE